MQNFRVFFFSENNPFHASNQLVHFFFIHAWQFINSSVHVENGLVEMTYDTLGRLVLVPPSESAMIPFIPFLVRSSFPIIRDSISTLMFLMYKLFITVVCMVATRPAKED
jgi:hypothetical protein